jgi:hypothetical protein
MKLLKKLAKPTTLSNHMSTFRRPRNQSVAKKDRTRYPYITQDAFQKGQVRLSRIMHEKTDLLNSISKIRMSQSESAS